MPQEGQQCIHIWQMSKVEQSSEGPVCEGADSMQDAVISIKKNHYIKVKYALSVAQSVVGLILICGISVQGSKTNHQNQIKTSYQQHQKPQTDRCSI